jgi:hypothetical protein
MTDPNTLAKWRKGFEMTSPETLRLLLARNEYDGDLRQQAVKWLREHDKIAAAIERKRFQTMLRWTIIGVVLAGIAAIAAVIAAWPVVQGWWPIIQGWIK